MTQRNSFRIIIIFFFISTHLNTRDLTYSIIIHYRKYFTGKFYFLELSEANVFLKYLFSFLNCHYRSLYCDFVVVKLRILYSIHFLTFRIALPT